MFTVPKYRRASRGHGEIDFLLDKIKSAHTLVLALYDEPYPYAVAVNYAPKVFDDELYLIFHGAKDGRRFKLLKKNPKVGFFITLQDEVINTHDCKSTNLYQSLAGEGEVLFLEHEKALLALEDFMAHFGSVKLEEDTLAKMGKMLSKMVVCALKVKTLGFKAHE